MPRIPRGQAGNVVHVLNRGNARETVFHSPSDYRAFIDLLAEARTRFDVDLFAFCLMPNHFHAVLAPSSSDELSRFMQWWLTSHVRRSHRRSGGSGHLWQGRFKSFPIQEDEHLLTVLRYVLLNPVRGGLCSDPEEWIWSSLHFPQLCDAWPLDPPMKLLEWLNQPIDPQQVARLQHSFSRRAPFGRADWQKKIARVAGLESTLRPRGRPLRIEVLSRL